jgi:hypothetical protein
MTAPVAGVCRYCGCTEDRACVLATGGGETCTWVDADRTVCNGPDGCAGKFLDDREREIARLQRADREMLNRMRARRMERRKRKGRAA